MDAPAYVNRHCLTIGGKNDAITTDGLIRFARMNDIKDAESIIAEVTKSVDHFSDYARECGIDDKWIKDIEKATH